MHYFDDKKRAGYIFTLHNIDPDLPTLCMNPEYVTPKPITEPEGPSFWSHLSGRYRTYEEQQAFVASGLKDQDLGAIPVIDPEIVVKWPRK